MGDVIGQRYEVYSYEMVKDLTLKKGEKIVVKTPDFGESLVELISPNTNKTVKQLYTEWQNGAGSPFRTAKEQDRIDDILVQELESEAASRRTGDANTLNEAKAYSDQAQLATQTWLPAVSARTDLPTTGLNTKINYLCRVIADPDQSKNGVYQAIAGWTSVPVWTYFSDNQDWIDETEQREAIAGHNQNGLAHNDIRQAISSEATVREAITLEVEAIATVDSALLEK
jgi:hypothetical protein